MNPKRLFQTIGLFLLFFTASAANNESGVLSNNVLNSNVSANIFGIFDENTMMDESNDDINLFTPGLLSEIANQLQISPPIRSRQRAKVRHASYKDIEENAIYAGAMSCPLQKIKDWNCRFWCTRPFQTIRTFSHPTVKSFAFIGIDTRKQYIVLTFRGAVKVRNWIDNLMLNQMDFPFGSSGTRVHQGFYTSFFALYHNIKEELESLVKNPEYSGYKVIMTGYSLGAAQATIAAATFHPLVTKYKHSMELYAYGSPRVGNRKFVDYMIGLNMVMQHITYENDIVPHVPTRGGNYVHIPVEIYARKSGSEKGGIVFRACSQKYDEDPNCAWSHVGGPLSVVKHLILAGQRLSATC